MRERVNPKFTDAVRQDESTGTPLFDSALGRTAPPETVTPSETRRESYLKVLSQPGKLNAQQMRILAVIRARGPISSRKIEKVTNIPRHVVTARIAELRDDLNLIVKLRDDKGNVLKMPDEETNRNVEVYVAKDAAAPAPQQHQKNRQHFDNFTDVVHFGKHKGWTIDRVLDENPNWLQWAILNDVVTVSPRVEADLILALKK